LKFPHGNSGTLLDGYCLQPEFIGGHDFVFHSIGIEVSLMNQRNAGGHRTYFGASHYYYVYKCSVARPNCIQMFTLRHMSLLFLMLHVVDKLIFSVTLQMARYMQQYKRPGFTLGKSPYEEDTHEYPVS